MLSSDRKESAFDKYLSGSPVTLHQMEKLEKDDFREFNIEHQNLRQFNGQEAILMDYDFTTKRCSVKIGSVTLQVNVEQILLTRLPLDGKAGHFAKHHLKYSKWPLAMTQAKGTGWGFKPEKRCQNVVFVGPTGAGKSRLINFLLGKDLFVSSAGTEPVTKKIESAAMTAMFSSRPTQFNFIDTVGLLDAKLSNQEVLKLAATGVQDGFTKMNHLVFVLRNGRVYEPESQAIQQAITWFGLDQPDRKVQVSVIITHCDALSTEENERVIARYRKHAVVGQLFSERQTVKLSRRAMDMEHNFFCVGLPDLQSLDPELKVIFRKRLVVQRHALMQVIATTMPAMAPTVSGASWLRSFWDENCVIL